MLREYALTPQIFSRTVFESDTVRRLSLAQLHNELTKGPCVLRGLGNGAWAAAALSEAANDMIGLKLFEAITRRFGLEYSAAQAAIPEREWIGVAKADHEHRALRGIICSPQNPTKDELVSIITELDQCVWWSDQTNSWCIDRTLASYRKLFEPLFLYSKEITFVDQYIDPQENNYRDFSELLRFLHFKNQSCVVSIHRPFRKISRGENAELTLDEWEVRFQPLADHARHPFRLVLRTDDAYSAQKFKSHERFLITNRMILSLTNGFDTERGASLTAALVERDDVRRFYETRDGLDVRSRQITPTA